MTRTYGTEPWTQRTDWWLSRGRDEWEAGVRRCKLSYIERIHNKVLLYSTENYTQHAMINHDGKEYKKRMHIYIHV